MGQIESESLISHLTDLAHLSYTLSFLSLYITHQLSHFIYTPNIPTELLTGFHILYVTYYILYFSPVTYYLFVSDYNYICLTKDKYTHCHQQKSASLNKIYKVSLVNQSIKI